MSWPIIFRQHVFKTKEEEGLTYQQTADRFNIGISTLFRWARKIEPDTKNNHRPLKISMTALEEDIKRYPDAYQRERAARLGVSKHCIWNALKKLGVTYKKNPSNTRKLTLLPEKNLQKESSNTKKTNAPSST